MSVVVRQATEDDIEEIVRMLGAHWTEQTWSAGKYRYYYASYPMGTPLSFVAVADGVIVAFVGLLPVVVSGLPAFLVLQVFVSPHHRRGATLVELVRLAENTARDTGALFLCGFGNRRFAAVAERFLGWRIPGYLAFVERESIDLASFRARFHFEYEDAWYLWKFGVDREVHTQDYARAGVVHRQLLKTRTFRTLDASSLGVTTLNLWHPDAYSGKADGEWIQPFLVAPLSENLPAGLLDIHHWYIEMGDSDAIEPHRPWVS